MIDAVINADPSPRRCCDRSALVLCCCHSGWSLHSACVNRDQAARQSGTPASSGGQELYQLLSYKGDVDLEAKLDEWERFNNFHRPYGAHNGKTPYETLREKL